jgi:hypothetical protein
MHPTAALGERKAPIPALAQGQDMNKIKRAGVVLPKV